MRRLQGMTRGVFVAVVDLRRVQGSQPRLARSVPVEHNTSSVSHSMSVMALSSAVQTEPHAAGHAAVPSAAAAAGGEHADLEAVRARARAHFPQITPASSFLDNAAGSMVPAGVVAAVAGVLAERGAANALPGYAMGRAQAALKAAAHAATALFLNACSAEVALGPSATAMSFRLASGLAGGLARGDALVVSGARRGARRARGRFFLTPPAQSSSTSATRARGGSARCAAGSSSVCGARGGRAGLCTWRTWRRCWRTAACALSRSPPPRTRWG